MSGKATVTVELNDGTTIKYQCSWSGGNPAFEGAEAAKAARRAADSCRDAIEATHGALPKQAVFDHYEGRR